MSSATTTPTVKVPSKFAAKSGFVIPKNKLSGSLVPIFKGGKTRDAADSGEPPNQAHRRTKWGPDLTQDVVVRKGRALAYQTRVEQITKQLESGVLEPQGIEHSQVAGQDVDAHLSSPQTQKKESELLELEKREAIGEILKLNPSYKAPPDYKPLLKESRVPIPVKEYPGYNFIGLIFGPGCETQKRLEKETGAKIQVIGRKANTAEKVEISPSDKSGTQGTYEELTVHVSAEMYEKVDAAVSLIELLLTSVSEKLESGDNANVHNQSHEVHRVINEGFMPPAVDAAQVSHQGQFQYQNPWFPAISHQGAVNPTSGLISPQTSAPILSSPGPSHFSPYNPSTMPSAFGISTVPASGFNSVIHNPSLSPAGPLQPVQVLSNTYPPRNLSTLASQPPSIQANVGAQHPTTGPSIVSRPLMPQLVSVSQGLQMSSPVVPSPGTRPLLPQPGFPSGPPTLQTSTIPSHLSGALNAAVPIPQMGSFPTSTPIQSSISPLPIALSNLAHRAAPISSAMTPTSQTTPQFGIPSFPGTTANFTPIRSPTAVAPRPQHSSPGDFTFQPQHLQNPASHAVPRLRSDPATQNALPRPMMPPPAPQGSSFLMSVPNSTPQAGIHVFPRPQIHNDMNRTQAHMPGGPFAGNPTRSAVPLRPPAFPNPSPIAPPVLQMGSRNFGAIPGPPPNMTGPFPTRPENSMHFQQNYLPPAPRGQFMGLNQPFNNNARFASGRPANPGQQIYDPFSPTSVPIVTQQRGGNLGGKGSKQENDPEYEDLMASVGVK
ncbi:hypothetical protein Tsubulata_040525 [Turnera subulata]|uniref:K Homology domain-containing protein n=1 Tax=Turnera subulata TaxID=218843 RepID=A0A9Q0FZK0_9ROSI|nr:hypothetical protein Tsubulata_040525 [Turnera subulata]